MVHFWIHLQQQRSSLFPLLSASSVSCFHLVRTVIESIGALRSSRDFGLSPSPVSCCPSVHTIAANIDGHRSSGAFSLPPPYRVAIHFALLQQLLTVWVVRETSPPSRIVFPFSSHCCCRNGVLPLLGTSFHLYVRFPLSSHCCNRY